MTGFEDEMCRAAAYSLFSSLTSLRAFHFNKTHVPEKLIADISELNLNQQKWLIGRAEHFVTCQLNSAALERQLHELDAQKEEYQLENTFILKGAPRSLMRRLFGMHASEFARRREVLGLQGISIGRPPKCEEAVEHKLWLLWQEQHGIELRQRFIELAEETGQDLHIIWGALKDYIDI
ncbi:MAG: DUF2857 domain-containing protein [Pseudomonadales bacterium]|nr:DUF2857 domain-containing protein [Pseudomonadales bacterium]